MSSEPTLRNAAQTASPLSGRTASRTGYRLTAFAFIAVAAVISTPASVTVEPPSTPNGCAVPNCALTEAGVLITAATAMKANAVSR